MYALLPTSIRCNLRATATTVAIYAEDVRIATHSRNDKGKRSTHEPHLPEHRRDLRHRSQSHWQERAARIGPETARFIAAVFDSDDVSSQLRKVQSIVSHLEGFPTTRAEAAARRAQFFGTYSYQGVKSILAKGLDFEPLPAVVVAAPAQTAPPRFARNVHELLAHTLENSNEPH